MINKTPLSLWLPSRLLAGLLVLFAFGPIGNAQDLEPAYGVSTDADAARLFAEGFEAHKNSDLATAEQRYRASLYLDPNQPRVWWELGWIHVQRQENQRADEAWNKVRELDPAYPGLVEHHGELKARIALEEQLAAAEVEDPRTAPAGERMLRIAAGGDTMMGSDFRKGSAGLPKNDGKALFEPVAPYMKEASIAFVNLEGPLIDGGYSSKCGDNRDTCYTFRTPTRYVQNLVDAGVDVVSLANNHTMDFGAAGRDSTKSALDSVGIRYAGTTGDIARWSVDGLDVSLLAFAPNRGCYSLNDHATAVKLVEQEAAESHIVIVSFHGGAEGSRYQHVPHGGETFYGENRGDLRKFSRLVIDAGADLVIGHGPHVLRGLEVYRDRLIAYSLGNFVTYGGFNLSGANGLGALLLVDLDNSGAFKAGRIIPTIQLSPGGPRLDPESRAVAKIKELSLADFPSSHPTINDDGSLSPRND